MQTRKQTGKGKERERGRKRKQTNNENTYLLLSDFRGNARGYTKVNDSIVSSLKAITSCLNASLYSRQAGRQAGTDASRRLQQCPSATFSIQPEGGGRKKKKKKKQIITLPTSFPPDTSVKSGCLPGE